MASRKWIAAASVFALLATACGSDPLTTPSLDSYVTAMQAVNARTVAEADAVDVGQAYPLGGDLVGLTELYTVFDDRLAGWRSLVPPEEFAALHSALLEAVDALQSAVGAYLMDEALGGGEFYLSDLGPKVQQEINAASSACEELQRALSDAGSGPIFSDCQF